MGPGPPFLLFLTPHLPAACCAVRRGGEVAAAVDSILAGRTSRLTGCVLCIAGPAILAGQLGSERRRRESAALLPLVRFGLTSTIRILLCCFALLCSAACVRRVQQLAQYVRVGSHALTCVFPAPAIEGMEPNGACPSSTIAGGVCVAHFLLACWLAGGTSENYGMRCCACSLLLTLPFPVCSP